MTRVLVTGATGFVGRSLCMALADAGYTVRAALRTDQAIPAAVAEKVVVGEIGRLTDWTAALTSVELVIHTAARAHVFGEAATHADLYEETNAHGTGRLAEMAGRHGVRRLVYLSSVKVNGEGTTTRPYTPDDPPLPQDAYGSSKWLGEKLLYEVAARSTVEVAVLRSPLVYGPGVRANFLRLLSWVDKGWPLPLGAVNNRRSLVSVWNLCDLLIHLLQHEAAAGRTWMASDGDDLSTPQLIRCIGKAMNKQVSLIPVPVALLRLGGRLLGRSAEINRLCGSLVVDIARTRHDLAWNPAMTVADALARTAAWYADERHVHAV
jgi:nucleoside-diphosphate-sugar epimerase